MNEFDTKAALWDLNPMHLERSRAVAKQIAERIPVNQKMKVLEYGAGTGLTSFILRNHLREITMMDNSREMVRKMEEKIKLTGSDNLKAVYHDLELEAYDGETFDLIIAQMVLHHIVNTEDIITKFHSLLNAGGFLAIADLKAEDGTYHKQDFAGHKGFDTKTLSETITRVGFQDISVGDCFTINKENPAGNVKRYEVFLMIAKKT